MNANGKELRRTEKAVLFKLTSGPLAGRELWFPLSQCEVLSGGGYGEDRIVTTQWIAREKAGALGLTAEIEAHYKECAALEKEERSEKKLRRQGKKLSKKFHTLLRAGKSYAEAHKEVYGER
jgi:hypothetical protein